MPRLLISLSIALSILLLATPSAHSQRFKTTKSARAAQSTHSRVQRLTKDVHRAEGSMSAKLKQGEHTLRLPGIAKPKVLVARGTSANMKYQVGNKGQFESAEIRFNKSVEVRDLASSFAAEKTKRAFLPVRVFAKMATTFANPKLKLDGLFIQADGKGFRVIPRIAAQVSLGPIKMNLNQKLGSQDLLSMGDSPVSAEQGRRILNMLVESVGGNFAAEVGMGAFGKAGTGSVNVTGDFQATPTERGFKLGGTGLKLNFDGPGVRGNLDVTGSLEID